MDISSGAVAFGVTCPGSLMEKLQQNDLENVRKIKSFQTSFASRVVTWQCHAPSKDLSIVTNFIGAINALEELSIINFEDDPCILWPAIFHHSDSLKTLSIHTPPQMQPDVWTVPIVVAVKDALPHLKRLEMDIDLKDAENFYTGTTQAQLQSQSSEPADQSILDQLTTIDTLESVLINVNLKDDPSTFAERHTWNVMGCISFPGINKDPCKQLAEQIFDAFHSKNKNSALKHLELRFARRCWDDRCQFWTLAHSTHVRADEAGKKVEADENWREYLPEFPRDGILRTLASQGYAESMHRL